MKGERKLTCLSLFIVLLIFGTSIQASCAVEWQWIAPQRVYSLLRERSSLWLIDIRNKSAFENLHAEGAMHIAADSLLTRMFPRQKTLVIVDDSLGLRMARDAAALLVKSGHEKVYLMEDGLPGWRAEKLPVVGNRTGSQFRRVTMGDLQWALQNRIPVQILDLRSKDEQAGGIVPKAESVPGLDLKERLLSVAKRFSGKESTPLTLNLEKPATVVLVFPLEADPLLLMEQFAGILPVDAC